jgi:hypothetical protein
MKNHIVQTWHNPYIIGQNELVFLRNVIKDQNSIITTE